MSTSKIFKTRRNLSCENHLPYLKLEDIMEYLYISSKLNISLLFLESITIEERDQICSSLKMKDFLLLSAREWYNNARKDNFDLTDLAKTFKSYLNEKDGTTILASRITLRERTIETLKKQLGKNRRLYEIVCIQSDDKSILKWAVHDRRVDYLSMDIINGAKIVDTALCSLIKQNQKCLELNISPLFTARTNSELVLAMRKGKKVISHLNSKNVPFILTCNPSSPLMMRNGEQIRHIATLLGAKLNKTKSCVFEKQLTILLTNLAKLDENFVIEGIWLEE